MNLIDRLYAREIGAVAVDSAGSLSEVLPEAPVILAGSFNPLHTGHQRLLEACESLSGRNGWFEISVQNVDKPDLERQELVERLAQFRGYRGVVLTRAPRFIEKARLLPGAAFAIGFDTALRLFDDRYYDVTGSLAGEPKWVGVLREIARLGSSFMVAGRALAGGAFRELMDINIPAEFESMFVAVPQSMFREDISSTELRNRRSRNS